MAILKVKIATARPENWLVSNFQNSGGGSVSGDHSKLSRLINFLTSLHTGSELFYDGADLVPGTDAAAAPQAKFEIVEAETAASATLTFASTVATNSFVINGVTFTCVASGATGNQFNIGVSDALTAASAAAAVNASVTALVAGYVTASVADAVVTITSDFPGLAGNQVTLSSSANITSSAARLAGGAVDANATTCTF